MGNRYPLGLSLDFSLSAALSDWINASHRAISGSGSYFGLFLARIFDGDQIKGISPQSLDYEITLRSREALNNQLSFCS